VLLRYARRVTPRQRRGKAVEGAVLQAAQHALDDVGLVNFSVAQVAAEAGVHPTSVYRRWPTREALLADVLLSRTRGEAPVPDSGDLAADLLTFLTRLGRYLATPVGEAALRLSGSPDCPPELRDEFAARRLGDVSDRLAREPALAALSTADKQALFFMLIGPVQASRHWAAQTMPRQQLTGLVDHMLALARTWADGHASASADGDWMAAPASPQPSTPRHPCPGPSTVPDQKA
jgi:AcrR family transcriptional regulator